MVKLNVIVLLFALVSPALALAAADPVDRGYAGAQACQSCHEAEFSAWTRSGHAKILLAPGSEASRAFPVPAGYAQGNISFIIGGSKWKGLYIDANGYIITSTVAGPGKNQYNVRSRTWADYRAGEQVPYDCGRCHTTGYSQTGHQGGREGIVGTWAFAGVQCEACHGPGARHAASASKTDITTERNRCQSCHGTLPLDIIPIDGVFFTPYTTANQLARSAMNSLTCLGCHGPHSTEFESSRASCASCHAQVAQVYERSLMFRARVSCIDCHMPPASRVAEGDPKTFTADLKSHLFTINHQADFRTDIKDGLSVSPGFLTVDYSCTPCHHLFESRQWLVSYASIAHSIRTVAIREIFRFQMALTTMGILLAFVALLSAAAMKDWLGFVPNKRRLVRLHRFAGWATFSIFCFVGLMCLTFHLPRVEPARVFSLGWFSIHAVVGVLGFIFYFGKILTVRKYHAGWKLAGILWGAAIFLAWILLSLTAGLSYFNVLRV